MSELMLTFHKGGPSVRKGLEEEELDDCCWFFPSSGDRLRIGISTSQSGMSESYLHPQLLFQRI
jgi:hypothetical protein